MLRELLEAVRRWEEEEQAGHAPARPALAEKKKLAPLHEGGPTQLLQLQISRLEQENSALRVRMKTVRRQFSQLYFNVCL